MNLLNNTANVIAAFFDFLEAVDAIPPHTTKPMIKYSTVRDRYSELGIWNSSADTPVFGWAPVLFGWCVHVEPSAPELRRILINGVPWDPLIGKIGFSFASDYAKASYRYPTHKIEILIE